MAGDDAVAFPQQHDWLVAVPENDYERNDIPKLPMVYISFTIEACFPYV